MGHRLGLKELVAIGVGGMIGGGIFSVLGLVLKFAGPLTPLAFLWGGIVATFSAYSYAKLSYWHPCLGGTIEYIYMGIKNKFIVRYINALLWFGYVIMIALYAYAFGSYAAATLGLVEGTPAYLLAHRTFATLALLAFMYINILGVSAMGKVEDVLVYAKVAILLLFGAIGLMFSNPSLIFKEEWPSWIDLFIGANILFLAYEGFGIISNAGLEAKDKKDLYRAFFIAVVAVTFIYVLIAYVAVTTTNVKNVSEFADYALGLIAEPILGKAGFALIALAAIFSTSSAINATIFGAARIAYFLGKDEKVTKEKVDARRLRNEIILTTLVAWAIATFYSLENISLMGSIAFLLIYAAVNYVALKFSDKIGARPIIPFLALTFTLMSAFVLASLSLSASFWSQLKALLTLFLPPLFITLFILVKRALRAISTQPNTFTERAWRRRSS